MEGGVSKVGDINRIVDTSSNMPISGAKITLPMQNYTTYSNNDGTFNLDTNIQGTSVLSVEKTGYRPYSITINEQVANRPLILGIEKSNTQDIVISTEMFHLGDDNFSSASANSTEFKGKSIGPFYSKTFTLAPSAFTRANYLVIGSIIGIDTLMARSMGQNSIINSFASPPEVYFNGRKIAEIQLNGDGQRIKLPNSLLKSGQQNEITIRTGHNLQQTAYIDYDDIELMNISIQSE
jgi:hypothetical protein